MTDDINERHRRRMVRKKVVVDASIAEANRDAGLLIVLTGNGKGKSSSAFGMVARALGHGMRVGIVQFIKGSGSTGEDLFFSRFPEVEFYVGGEGFTWDTQDRSRDIAVAQSTWSVAVRMLREETVNLVVLDEINIALKMGYLSVDEVLPVLQERPVMQHVVVTGRGAPEQVIEAADTVTELQDIKHAFRAGIRAQRGVEW